MSTPATSENFADILDVRFRDIFNGLYPQMKSRIPDFFTETTSDRPEEKYSALTDMGPLQLFTGAIAYDNSEQEYDVTATHLEYALGTQIRRKLYDDDQFGVIDEEFEKLTRSAFRTHENHAADFFNNAFSAVSSFYTHTEAVALCSDSHTTPVAGVSTTTGFDNYVTSELSPANLTSMITQFRGFKTGAGDFIDSTPDTLVVPVNLEDRANEIVRTVQGLDDANQNKNVMEGRFKIVSWIRLTDVNNYWIANQAEMKRNLLWFWRVKPETAKMESFDNIIAKGRIYTRYSFLRRDWRWALGAEVS